MPDESIALSSEPFGDPDVDTEMKRLRGRYENVYLVDTQFSARALDPNVYLISGRRGTGKTALSQYFSFQRQMPGILHIEVRERDAYPQVLTSIANLLSKSAPTAIPQLVDVWHLAIWTVIVEHLRDKVDARSHISQESNVGESPAGLLTKALQWTYRMLQEGTEQRRRANLPWNFGGGLTAAVQQVKEFARSSQQQIVLSIDTLEKYDTDDPALMLAVAALIHFASDFNLDHSPDVQVKVFLPGEIYTQVEEAVLLAPSKHIRMPLHLIWTPGDLLRLIMWRFWKYLFLGHAHVRHKPPSVRWSDPGEVYKKMWREHFAKHVVTPTGNELSLTYILRHTQMRPRQLIHVCNAIAEANTSSDTPYNYGSREIVAGIANVQGRLVADVVNSFILTHPRVNKILDAAAGAPPVITEQDLSRLGERTLPYWDQNTYSPDRFRDLLSDLGVIGRITGRRGRSAKIIEAEFSHSTPDRIVIGVNADCVIHPMFYRRLNVDPATAPRVLPFGKYETEMEQLFR